MPFQLVVFNPDCGRWLLNASRPDRLDSQTAEQSDGQR
jgi:hypothetical protein